MILVVDNYDSFAYNLVQYVAEALAPRYDDPLDGVTVRRNDEIGVADVRDLDPDGIVVSPGPGTPADAGISVPVFAELSYPTLGVCLGHQALCAANGATVGRAQSVVHGKPSTVTHDGEGVYADLPNPIRVGRYHSLAVERDDLPDSLVETAVTRDERGVVMGVRHRSRPHEGVQFHPESILTGRVEADGGTGGTDGGCEGESGVETGSVGDPEGDGGDTTADLSVGKRLVSNFVETCTTT